MPRKVLSRRPVASVDEPEVNEPSLPPAPDAPASSKMNPFAAAVMVIVLLAAGGLLVKNTLAKQKVASNDKPNTDTADTSAETDVQQVVNRVAKHIKIKADEVPTVATVQDADVLRQNNPAFYQYAKNGDRLLIWSDKAVLYSATEDILLAVMPVTVSQAPTGDKTAPDAQAKKESASVEVRNASGVAGLGKTLATKLKSLGMEVLAPGDAKSKTAYEKSVIFVKPGVSIPNTVKALQEQTGATIVEALPADEAALKGDVVIILGLEYKK